MSAPFLRSKVTRLPCPFCAAHIIGVLTLPPSFFSSSRLLRVGAALGLFPVEKNYDIHSYQTQSFRVEPYLNSGFCTVEPVWVRQYLDDAIPYTVVIALKCQRPITCMMLTGGADIRWATFLSPQTVSLSVLDTIPPNRRHELMLTRYHRAMSMYQENSTSRV